MTPHAVDVKRHIGLVPQELAIYPGLSARENLLFFGRLQKMARSELVRRVDEVLELIGLDDRAKDRSAPARGRPCASSWVPTPDVLVTVAEGVLDRFDAGALAGPTGALAGLNPGGVAELATDAPSGGPDVDLAEGEVAPEQLVTGRTRLGARRAVGIPSGAGERVDQSEDNT